MTAHSQITRTLDRPFTPETLAARWGISASAVRNACQAGAIKHFRLGKLYRIPAAVVEETEACQTSASDDLEAGSASIGALTESEPVIALRHPPERKRKPKP